MKKLIDIELLKKKTPSQPTAEYLEIEFEKFLEYCQEKDVTPTKHSWRVFLNVLDQTIGNWMAPYRGVAMFSEEEYEARRVVLKKIDKIIENALANSLINSDRTNGNLIFYLKNSYKWTDRPQEDAKAINVNIGSVAKTSPKKRKTK